MASPKVLLLVAVLAGQAPQHPPPYPRPGTTQILENDVVAVWDVAWLKQQYPLHTHRYDLIGISYADVTAQLEKEGVALPSDRPSSRIRALIWLARRLGSAAVVPMVLETEAGDADKYEEQGGEATAIAEEERAHRQVLKGMEPAGAPSGARALIADRERWHRGGGRAGSIRAAIFGMNDGLVSNLSLILGVAGAGVAPATVVVTGFAGLLAGAFSMAVGEYTSVASQRDLLARQIAGLVRRLPELIDQARDKLMPLVSSLLARAPEGSVAKVQEAATGHAEKAVELAIGFLGGVITSGAAIIDARAATPARSPTRLAGRRTGLRHPRDGGPLAGTGGMRAILSLRFRGQAISG